MLMSKNLKTTAYVRVTAGQKSKGHTAKAKVDYILRQGAFKAKGGLVASGAGHLPPGFKHHRQYWQKTDAHERANSVAFREFLIDLPDHLSMPEAVKLAEKMAEHISRNPENDAPLTYQYAVHADPETGHGRHLHLVVSERCFDGVERTPELFFKQQNNKGRNPEKGGAPKLPNNFTALKNRTDKVKSYVANVINATLNDLKIPSLKDPKSIMQVDFNINKKDGKIAQVKLSKRNWLLMQDYKLDNRVTINKYIERFLEIDIHNEHINSLMIERDLIDKEIKALELDIKTEPVIINKDIDELDFSLSNEDLLAQIEAEYAREDEAARQAQSSTAHSLERNNDPEL